MKILFKGLALAALCAGTAQAANTTDRLVPFEQFVRDTSAARLSTFQGLAGTRVQNEAAFNEMRQHVLSLYDGVRVDHSFMLDTQVFDCVPVAQQPSVRLLGLKGVEAPPAPSSPSTPFVKESGEQPRAAASPLERGKQDPFGNELRCESGTIPMRRVTLEGLSRFESLRHFLGKGPDGAGRPFSGSSALAPVTHRYAHAYQWAYNYGGESRLNLWSPPINTGAGQIFSLSQHWYVGGSGAALQTVEGGWQVYPALYGTTNAVTFIYFTPDNYTTGCYNLDCPGFVQINPNWPLGGAWSIYSTFGGTQYEFRMQWKFSGGNWWLFLQGNGTFDAVGYYPGSLYRGGQLSQFATEIDYGGETVGPDTFPPMGSGGWGGWGWTQAAYQRAVFYTDLANAGQWSSLTSAQPSPSCYSLAYTPASSGGDWGTYFFFGGPGGWGC
ncbi:neprosin family prolyl endopeptidase [Corallococcus sp. CA053C]|uniref:neprosin family prolyl endopeptidase n=1 Tax=Corallococcus sp. CA053C TaxID=2316732 RepID=UPI0013155914|nr:neprosin family prolyl endopeptidase [Corallococcus sp. CA053C]